MPIELLLALCGHLLVSVLALENLLQEILVLFHKDTDSAKHNGLIVVALPRSVDVVAGCASLEAVIYEQFARVVETAARVFELANELVLVAVDVCFENLHRVSFRSSFRSLAIRIIAYVCVLRFENFHLHCFSIICFRYVKLDATR